MLRATDLWIEANYFSSKKKKKCESCTGDQRAETDLVMQKQQRQFLNWITITSVGDTQKLLQIGFGLNSIQSHQQRCKKLKVWKQRVKINSTTLYCEEVPGSSIQRPVYGLKRAGRRALYHLLMAQDQRSLSTLCMSTRMKGFNPLSSVTHLSTDTKSSHEMACWWGVVPNLGVDPGFGKNGGGRGRSSNLSCRGGCTPTPILPPSFHYCRHTVLLKPLETVWSPWSR